jgi:hypothetical protein
VLSSERPSDALDSRERDEEGVGGVKSLFPVDLLWDSTDGAEGEWGPEHHDAEIVWF